MARIPLVIVTGFLGAGKTTLINRLLARRAEGQALEGEALASLAPAKPALGASLDRQAIGKLGVVVNELGEIGIDGALLGGEATQIELPGGCVCCVLGDELDRTLVALVDANPELAAIVLETTGVAEPLPIAWAVRRAPVDQRVRLAAVVALIDATQFRASRPVSAAVDAQVAYADVLLVTKRELAEPGELDAALAIARELAPRALVRIGTSDDHAAWLESTLADPSLEHAPAADDHDHDHDHGIASISLEVPDVIDLEELEDQLAELPAGYVRIKGIVRAVDERGDVGWHAVHRVGLRVSSEPVRPPEPFGGRLVALGTELSRDQLARCIAAAAT